MHADDTLSISSGTIDITRSYEGLEGAKVLISGGKISIVASDDGINAAGGSDQSGFGGFGFSHINDSFFWILTKYLNMSVSEGLRTWTLITSVIGIVGFFFTWLVTMLFF